MTKTRKNSKIFLLESDGYLISVPIQDLKTADPDIVFVGDEGVSFSYGSKVLQGEVLFVGSCEDDIKKEMVKIKTDRKKGKMEASFHAELPRLAKKRALETNFASGLPKVRTAQPDKDKQATAKQEKKRKALLKDRAALVTQAELEEGKKPPHTRQSDKSDSEDSSSSDSSSSEVLPKSNKVKDSEVKKFKAIVSSSESDSCTKKYSRELEQFSNEEKISGSVKVGDAGGGVQSSGRVEENGQNGKVNSPQSGKAGGSGGNFMKPADSTDSSENCIGNEIKDQKSIIKSAGQCLELVSPSSSSEISLPDSEGDTKNGKKKKLKPQDLPKKTSNHEDECSDSELGGPGKQKVKGNRPSSSESDFDIKKNLREQRRQQVGNLDKSAESPKDDDAGDVQSSAEGNGQTGEDAGLQGTKAGGSAVDLIKPGNAQVESNKNGDGKDSDGGKGKTIPVGHCMKLDSSSNTSVLSGSEPDEEILKKKKKVKKNKKSSKKRKLEKAETSDSESDEPRKPKIKRNRSIYPGVNYLYSKDDNGVVKLHPEYDVYIKERDLLKAKADAKTVMGFIRLLVDKVYTEEALQNSTAQGFPPRSKGRKKLEKVKVLPAIHPDGRLAIIAAARDLEDTNKTWRPRKDQNTLYAAFTQRMSDFKN